MAKNKKTKISDAMVAKMLAGKTSEGTSLIEMTPDDIRSLLGSTKSFNGRDGRKPSEKLQYSLGTNGRLDSFTAACGTLEQAEELYEFAFGSETDHVFLYTRASAAEGGIHDGYAMCIIGGRLSYFAARRDDAGRLHIGDAFAIGPNNLIDFLNRCNQSHKEDTVYEQMAWIRAAEKRGLISPDYPTFRGGFLPDGPCLALSADTPAPADFLQEFD